MAGKGLCFFLLLSLAVLNLHHVHSQEDADQDAENANLYGGDIMLTPEQQLTLEATANPNDPFSPQAAVVRNQRSLWPNGVVPYILDGSLNDQARNAITAAINTFARLTCIRFIQRSNQADYVRFFPGGGCFSFIGRVGRGSQDISIGRGCEFEGIVLHEMFHALGRWHEQSRPDRDNYVRIIKENIQSGRENNFEITNPNFVTTQSVPYDLMSIMHYGAGAFSSNGRFTIEPLDPNVRPEELGQRRELTESDLEHVRTLYCRGTEPVSGSWSSWSSYSACSRSCNGGSQTRTRTCVGGSDCEGSNIQRRSCNTGNCPNVVSTWGQWSSWSGCSATCGGGRQRRTRFCRDGNNCVGSSNQFRDCNTVACPQPASWSSWGSWAQCSQSCQGGVQVRRRTCLNGNTCRGDNQEFQDCNINTPCNPLPFSSQWSSWTPCSELCGGGRRFRNRNCVAGANCQQTEIQSCNEGNCPGIRPRSCAVYTSPPLRLLENSHPLLMDDPFRRQNAQVKCAIASLSSGLRFFGQYFGYCLGGSNDPRDYELVPATGCQNGRGAYDSANRRFLMDVYEVVDARQFDETVMVAPNGTLVFNSTEEMQGPNSGGSRIGGGASGGSTLSVTLAVAALLGLTLITLFL